MVVIILIGGAIYLGRFNTPKTTKPQDLTASNQASQSPADETANWKTYENKELGISFKYPDNWFAKPYTTDDNEENKVSDVVVDLAPENYNGVLVGFVYYNNPQNLPLEEWDKKRKELPGVDFNLYSQTDKSLNMTNGVKAYYREDGFCEPSACQIYTWSYKDKIYQLMNFKSKVQGQDQDFQTLFSTIKFLDPNQSNIPGNWKNYTNTKAGFSFRYPSDHTAYASADQQKPALIPATPTSNTVNIAAKEDMVFCCEPVTLSFSVKATTKKPKEWVEEYLRSVPEWEQELPAVKIPLLLVNLL